MSQPETNATLTVAHDAIDELKGESVRILDVSELTTIADHMIICTGRTARHVKSISDSVTEQTKKAGLQPRVEGLQEAEWVLIDLNGVIVHILQPEARAWYQLEKLWDMDSAVPENRQRK